MSDNFWLDKLREAQPPAPTISEGERRGLAFWHGPVASSQSRGAQIQATRERIYSDSVAPKGLGDYTSNRPQSKYVQKAGESDTGYIRRLQPLLHHLADNLSEAELGTVAESYNAAVTRLEGGTQTHAELREQLGPRQDVGTTILGANGVGVLGSSTPKDRAAQLAGRPRDARAPMSMTEVRAAMNAREAQLKQPVQSDVSQLRSTGTGFTGVDPR
jgi:hypothetical protein